VSEGEGTFYLEFLTIAGQVKVMAIDPDTGIEVCIIAPENASQAEMTKVAVDKLKRRIAKETSQSVEPKRDEPKRGILV